VASMHASISTNVTCGTTDAHKTHGARILSDPTNATVMMALGHE